MRLLVQLATLALLASCHGQRAPETLRQSASQPDQNGGAEAHRSGAPRVAPPTLAEAVAGSPLGLSLDDRNETGCSQTTVTSTYEGPFTLSLDGGGAGVAQLIVEHRDHSRSFVDGRGPRHHTAHRRYTWSVEARRAGEVLTLELTPAPGCELIRDTPPNTLFGCPPETPSVTLECSALRVGELQLPTAEPQAGLPASAVGLRCQSTQDDENPLWGALWFLQQPFVIAPAPGMRLTHARGDNLIEGELIRPD